MKRSLIEDNMDNVIDLSEARLATGGGFGREENWLKQLPKGMIFVCKKKNHPKEMLALDLFFVIEHKDQVSNVIQKIPTGQQADMWVNSLEFSRFYKFEESIATVELEYQTTPETTDGNPEGSVQPEGVDNDAGTEDGHSKS